MTARSITLPSWLINRLLDEALQTPQVEVCGLVGRQSDGSCRLYPVTNIADTPDCRFRLAPGEQIDAMRRMRERGETLFAIYHSHPDAPARPSPIDIEEAAYPEAVHLIISLAEAAYPVVRGYRIADRQVAEVKLVIE